MGNPPFALTSLAPNSFEAEPRELEITAESLQTRYDSLLGRLRTLREAGEASEEETQRVFNECEVASLELCTAERQLDMLRRLSLAVQRHAPALGLLTRLLQFVQDPQPCLRNIGRPETLKQQISGIEPRPTEKNLMTNR